MSLGSLVVLASHVCCAHMCVDMYVAICVYKCVDECVDACLGTYMDMCIGMHAQELRAHTFQFRVQGVRSKNRIMSRHSQLSQLQALNILSSLVVYINANSGRLCHVSRTKQAPYAKAHTIDSESAAQIYERWTATTDSSYWHLMVCGTCSRTTRPSTSSIGAHHLCAQFMATSRPQAIGRPYTTSQSRPHTTCRSQAIGHTTGHRPCNWPYPLLPDKALPILQTIAHAISRMS